MPLALLLTFRTYGTWLHGDERGSVDRRRNQPEHARIPKMPEWEAYERSLMTQPALILSPEQQRVVTRAIARFAETHGWRLFALHVRTNHVHVVASVTGEARRAIPALKAAATAELRRAGLLADADRVWSRGGSVRALETERAVDEACKYVVEQQGSEVGVVGPEL